jgi:hypothetical protein
VRNRRERKKSCVGIYAVQELVLISQRPQSGIKRQQPDFCTKKISFYPCLIFSEPVANRELKFRVELIGKDIIHNLL